MGKHQELMDAAYDRWQESERLGRKYLEGCDINAYDLRRENPELYRAYFWTKEDFWAQLSPAEIVAVFTGNLNYQVENGGWLQWHDNGYSECADWLIGQLPKLGPVSTKVAAMVAQVMQAIEDWEPEVEEWVEDYWEEIDDQTGDIFEHDDSCYEMVPNEEGPEVDHLDGPYYEINDAFMAEVEVVLGLSEVDLQGLLDVPYEPEKSVPEPDEEGPVRYPGVRVKLVGADGNAFNVLGLVQRALGKANVPQEEVDLFIEQATVSDYDSLLATCCRWVNVR